MYKYHNYISHSLGTSMIFFSIRWLLFYKALCGGMRHFVSSIIDK